MDSDQTKGCCNWKVISIIIGCVEILLSIGLGFIFGVSYVIVAGEYQTAIVIFLICSTYHNFCSIKMAVF